MPLGGIRVHIDPMLGDRIGVIAGELWAGSMEAVERFVEAMNARPWWQKLLDFFEAAERAEAVSASFEKLRAEASRSFLPRSVVPPEFRYRSWN
jgi:hypothetical protein